MREPELALGCTC